MVICFNTKSLNEDVCRADQLAGSYDISTSIFHERGARALMVIVAGIGHGDTSSKPGRD